MFLKKLYFLPSGISNWFCFLFHKNQKGKKICINGRLRLYGKGCLVLGDNVRINSDYRMNPIGGNTFTSFYIKDKAVLSIGDNTGMSNAAVYASQKIEIGKNVKIGGSVKIYDTDFHSINYQERAMKKDPGIKSLPVCIGNDVFIGAHSIILKGVSIGDRSVVGAGSVVTKNIPPDELWAGVPARFIKKLGDNA